MGRLKKYAAVPTLLGPEPLSRKLKSQSAYGNEPWKPGEIPRKCGFSQIPVIQALDEKPMPYGEYFGVQKPENRGRGYKTGTVDIEGHETETKQTGTAHGGKKL